MAVVPQNLIRVHGNAGDSPGRANAVDFESGKRRREGYTALFLNRAGHGGSAMPHSAIAVSIQTLNPDVSMMKSAEDWY